MFTRKVQLSPIEYIVILHCILDSIFKMNKAGRVGGDLLDEERIDEGRRLDEQQIDEGCKEISDNCLYGIDIGSWLQTR